MPGHWFTDSTGGRGKFDTIYQRVDRSGPPGSMGRYVRADWVPLMKFVDLFAGLGGFHLALRRLGHRCVFASEIEPSLRELYKKNFGLEAKGDIRQVPLSRVPSHDILCAGFPCQPFSKAGRQEGLKCPRNGDLFDYVMEVLRFRTPKVLHPGECSEPGTAQGWRNMEYDAHVAFATPVMTLASTGFLRTSLGFLRSVTAFTSSGAVTVWTISSGLRDAES